MTTSTPTKLGLGGDEPKKITVYDNGGETVDRYTVFIGEDAYGMSDDPQSPQGFNQYTGYADDMDIPSLGREVELSTLPEAVQNAILERSKEE